MEKILHITMGLPGAGKSDWAKSYRDSKKTGRGWNIVQHVDHVEYDALKESRYYLRNDPDKIMKEFLKSAKESHLNEIILDSLVSDEAGIIKMILLLMPMKVKEIKIHYWVPDKERCSINDRGRRPESSSITISNMTLEMPDLERIKSELLEKSESLSKTKIELIKHYTMMKEDWKIFRDEIVKPIAHVDESDIVKSSSWSMGGSWADCWGNKGSVPGGPETEFVELDSILEKVCPNISFLQYKNICNKIINSDTRSEGDYYGGSVTYGYKYFNVRSLYEVLVEKGLYEIEK